MSNLEDRVAALERRFIGDPPKPPGTTQFGFGARWWLAQDDTGIWLSADIGAGHKSMAVFVPRPAGGIGGEVYDAVLRSLRSIGERL